MRATRVRGSHPSINHAIRCRLRITGTAITAAAAAAAVRLLSIVIRALQRRRRLVPTSVDLCRPSYDGASCLTSFLNVTDSPACENRRQSKTHVVRPRDDKQFVEQIIRHSVDNDVCPRRTYPHTRANYTHANKLNDLL